MAENTQEGLEFLLEVGRLVSSKLELSELLPVLLELAARVAKAESASLLLVDPETQELYFDVALGLGPELQTIRLKMGQGIAGWVAQENKPLIINDVSQDHRWDRGMDEKSGFKTRSIMALPLVLKGKVTGVIEVINRIGADFSFDDLKTLEIFSSQAAVAVENARLFTFLAQEKRKLEAVFSEMKEGAVLTDERGGILLINEAGRETLDFPSPSLRERLSKFSLEPSWEKLLESDSEPALFEWVRQEPKRLILEGSLVRSEEEGKRFLWIFRDVTAERQEARLKRSFLSLISHKLKTPLVSITGYSQLLVEEVQKPRESQNHSFMATSLGTVYSQGQKLSALVRRLLEFIDLQELEDVRSRPEAFDLDRAVEESLKSLRPFLERSGAVVEKDPSLKARVLGNEALVGRALGHLIENAVKFNPKEKKKVWVRCSLSEKEAEVRVQDDGPGIPPEEQKRLFKTFHQVDEFFTGQIEGWGLGLAYVKKAVELCGGRTGLESRLGEGSIFFFTLPRGEEP